MASPELTLLDLLTRFHEAQARGQESVSDQIEVRADRYETRTSRKGDQYQIVELVDRSASMQAKDFRNHLRDCGCPEFVRLTLRIEEYKGAPSAVIDGAVAISPDEDQQERFYRLSPRARARNQAQLAAEIASLPPDSAYRWLVEAAFEDCLERFALWPAAVKHHHNYPGGLLEHSLEVLRYARGLAALDGQPYDPHLLTAAALLHDLGKLDEYAEPPPVARGLGGEFAYHLAYGQVRLGAAVERCRQQGRVISAAVLYRVVHCIEMSHGAYRLDQQRHFQGPEARLISAADDYSARRQSRERERLTLAALEHLRGPALG